MSDTKTLITSLDQKVEQLLKSIKEQQSTLESKKKEVEELSKKLSDKEAMIQSLNAEKEAMKNAPVAVETKDSEDMKVRINELVKEIDNCISLLKV